MKTKKIIKAIAFVLIFLICFFSVQTVLIEWDKRDYTKIKGFFDERENSLDAVFLGSSSTYTFWTPPVAFAEHGITGYSFTNADQPTFAAKFLIDDALKAHPNAVYVVNVTYILEEKEYDEQLHSLISNYPFTANKLKMTDYLCDQAGLSLSERMEYYFPIIRFHERWSDITAENFDPPVDEFKSGSTYPTFLSTTTSYSDIKYDLETKAPLPEKITRGLNDLMNYCDKKDVKVLFVIVPQALEIEERSARQNTTVEILESRGFEVLDLRRHAEETGIDYSTDYYNEKHTNIHGSIKVTDYICRYLKEHYDFEDKRGLDEYSDWTEASKSYYELISKHLTDEDYKYLKK